MSLRESFRAQSNQDRSGDILISFSSRWGKILRRHNVKYIFRRKYPRSFVPRRGFIYVAAPFSQILGSFTVANIRPISFPESATIAGEGRISTSELRNYFEGYESIGCYTIELLNLFIEPISLVEIREMFTFFPPQSFVSLSSASSDWIDKKLSAQPAATTLVRADSVSGDEINE
jgi:predicted transcriptional regulator